MTPLQAWLAQPKRLPLAPVGAPSLFIDSNRGDDAAGDGTRKKPWRSLAKLAKILPGNVVAFANDSRFDLSTRVSWSASAGTAINGVTFTHYDPGMAPAQRPRFSWAFRPAAADWQFDSLAGRWYVRNPRGDSFYDEALMRIGTEWGLSMGYSTPADLNGDRQYKADDANARLYLWSPANIDPTSYYGGPGSVVIGEGKSGLFNLNACGSGVVFDGLWFEDVGLPVAWGDWSAATVLDPLTVQDCDFVGVGRAVYASQEQDATTTMALRVLGCRGRGIGHHGVHLYCKSRGSLIAGNRMEDGNRSRSRGGGLYAQEAPGGATALDGNLFAQNYLAGWRHNVADHPFDGAACYLEVGSQGWTVDANALGSQHHGIYVNSGRPVTITNNLCDDVDVPIVLGDQTNAGAMDSLVAHNSIRRSALTKYRTAGAKDDCSAPVLVLAKSGKATVRGNVIDSSAASAVRSAIGPTVETGDNSTAASWADDYGTAEPMLPSLARVDFYGAPRGQVSRRGAVA